MEALPRSFHNSPQDPETLHELFLAGARTIEAHGQELLFLGSKKRSAMAKRDVLSKRASINLFDLDVRWQLNPQQETAGRFPNFGDAGKHSPMIRSPSSLRSRLSRRKKLRCCRTGRSQNTGGKQPRRVLRNAYPAGTSGEQTRSPQDQVNKLPPGALARLSFEKLVM
jgi:hypothetical protein